MAGRLEGNADDDDVLFSDDSFLAAISNVEAQHMGRMSNVLSYDNGSKVCGEDSCGNGGVDNGIAGKRSAYSGGQNDVRGRSGQPSRAADGASGSYFEDENLKRLRTEDNMRSSWSTSPPGREHEAQLNSLRQYEVKQPEGEYMAALRGSNSELWQSSAPGRGVASSAAALLDRASGGNSKGGCYKCGMEGHWSKDCPGGKSVSSPARQSGEGVQGATNVQEKLCPCGAGTCTVFTANTEKNMGRSFYKCPLRKDEGQCTFFEWCDAGGQSMPNERFQDSSQQPMLMCKCGGGPCAVLTAKTEKNMGRQFYKCPAPQSCSFFQWCDEVGRDAGGNKPDTLSKATNFSGSGGSPLPAQGGCYKCGQQGHWSRDCPSQQPQYSSSFGGQSHSFNARGSTEERSTSSCFKCGGQGHWSSSCPNPGGAPGAQNLAKQGGAGTASGGSCYKCGNPGHWANRCPVAQDGHRS